MTFASWFSSRQARRSHRKLSLERLESRDVPSTFSVTTTLDNGNDVSPVPGSLRKAIVLANGTPNGGGPDTIAFSFPTSDLGYHSATGTFTVQPTAAFAAITDPVLIHGWSEPGFAGKPVIELNGASAGSANGLFITAGNTTIRGLVINRFFYNGIDLSGGGNNWIAGNYLGTNVTGTVALGTGRTATFTGGIRIDTGSHDNVIGTDGDGANDAIEGNVISGNAWDGVAINGAGCDNNVVAGNYIGTNLTGTVALGNGASGISIFFAGKSNGSWHRWEQRCL